MNNASIPILNQPELLMSFKLPERLQMTNERTEKSCPNDSQRN